MVLEKIFFFLLLSAADLQETDGPSQCVIMQVKESIAIHSTIPSFLKNNGTSQCQVQIKDMEMLKCSGTDVYIKRECFCSFFNVYEAKYHRYSSCPEGTQSDVVTALKCPDCKRYSLNNTWPCLNGGKLTCSGDEVAPNIRCQCPLTYSGPFCENKLENVTRICYNISKVSGSYLRSCSLTGYDCITYSRNSMYAYRCSSSISSVQTRGELPLCIDTEDFRDQILINPTATAPFSPSITCQSIPSSCPHTPSKKVSTRFFSIMFNQFSPNFHIPSLKQFSRNGPPFSPNYPGNLWTGAVILGNGVIGGTYLKIWEGDTTM